MSLMVSPVSKVSFGNGSVTQNNFTEQSVDDFLSRPGAFAKPDVQDVKPKKHKFLKFVAGALITAGVVAGALYGLRYKFPQVFDAAKSLEGLNGLEKFKGYITKGIGIGGEYVEKGATATINIFKNGWTKLSNLVKGNRAE